MLGNIYKKGTKMKMEEYNHSIKKKEKKKILI